MKLLPVVTCIGWAAAAGLGVTCFKQYIHIRELQLKNEAVSAARADISERTKTAEQRTRRAESDARALQELLANLQTKHSAESTAAASSRPEKEEDSSRGPRAADGSANAVELVKRWLAMMEDPDVARLAAQHQRAQNQRRYLSLLKSLPLDAQSRDALTDLLGQRKSAGLDVAVAMVKTGVDPMADPDLTQATIASERQKIDAQIHQLLGDQQYEEFKTGEQDLGRANVVSMLQQSLEYANASLSEGQMANVRQILKDNRVGHLNDQIVQTIMPTLTPNQVAPFTAFYEEYKAGREVHQIQSGQLQTMVTPTKQPASGGPH